MQINVALRQRGWSGRTRDLSHVGVLVYLLMCYFLLYSSARAKPAPTSGLILTICTSYDVFPHNEVPCGNHVNTAPNFGVKSPKNILEA